MNTTQNWRCDHGCGRECSDEFYQKILRSETKLADLARAGEIPGAIIGKRWIFSRALLLNWLAEETARQVASRRQPMQKPITTRKGPPDLSRYDRLMKSRNKITTSAC